MDTFTKSDPQCTVYLMQNEMWVKIGTTEHIDNNLNPDFKTSVSLDYHFEISQRLKFEFVDLDLNST